MMSRAAKKKRLAAEGKMGDEFDGVGGNAAKNKKKAGNRRRGGKKALESDDDDDDDGGDACDDEAIANKNFAMVHSYSNIMCVEFIGEKDVVIVREPWEDILRGLGKVRDVTSYGTG